MLDAEGRMVAASRRARESLPGLEIGESVPDELLLRSNTLVPVDVEGRPERLLYLGQPGELAAYEELRAGFTAAVSHELRTPLARLLALLESADLPDADPYELIRQAQAEVVLVRELIDDVLFLSELETGKEVVSLGTTQALPVLVEVREKLLERAERADVTIEVTGDSEVLLPRRPRPSLARDRARPRDREAHRHLRRRHGRGTACRRRRPRDPRGLPAVGDRERAAAPRAPSTARAATPGEPDSARGHGPRAARPPPRLRRSALAEAAGDVVLGPLV